MPASGSGTQATGEYCLVSGAFNPVDPAAPQIKFQIAMPTVWNNKIMMFGGGGYDGTIPAPTGNVPAGPATQLTPLGRGYATFASDSGHQANALGSEDASFGVNDEAVANFSGDALKKTRDAAVYLIDERYAVKAPKRAYFAGGSSGGRRGAALAAGLGRLNRSLSRMGGRQPRSSVRTHHARPRGTRGLSGSGQAQGPAHRRAGRLRHA
jgi:feruloyl esterase